MGDLPYLRALKGEMWYQKMGWHQSYMDKWIKPGLFRPIMHVMGFVMILGYALEYPHLRRARRTPTLTRFAVALGCALE